MQCPERETWWLLADGRLAPSEAEALLAHRAACERCRSALRAWDETARLLAAAGPDAARSAELARRAVAAYVWRLRLRRTAAAVALAAGFVLAITLLPRAFEGPAVRGAGPVDPDSLGGAVAQRAPAPLEPAGEGPAPGKAPAGEAAGRVVFLADASPVSFLCGATVEASGPAVLETEADHADAFAARLVAGTCRFTVAPGVRRFEVRTGDALVRVLGTVFTVSVDAAAGTTDVAVERGIVAVQSLDGGRARELAAGQSLSTSTWLVAAEGAVTEPLVQPPGDEPPPADAGAVDMPSKR